MVIIADSGSTKTDWCSIHTGQPQLIKTHGINPYLMDSATIRKIIAQELLPFLNGDVVSEVHFYGAGCSTETKCVKVKSILLEFFPHALIETQHDLLGAARAACGHKPGIAAILGTGSNSCLFDGNEITDSIVSLGYFFGDEGSGAYLGKNFLTAYLHRKVPAEVNAKFEETYKPTVEKILDSVYNTSRPSRYLASFCPFLLQESAHPWVKDLIIDSFDGFFREMIQCYDGYEQMKVNFVGSIAYHFRDFLHESAANFNVTTGTILKSAIEGLVDYHQQIN